MNSDEKIGKIKEIVSDDVAPGDLSIVVLHRGWIFVGELRKMVDAYSLTKCQNVRKWDKGGFGGLTRGAKSSGATLDDCQDIVFDSEAMIFSTALPRGWHDA